MFAVAVAGEQKMLQSDTTILDKYEHLSGSTFYGYNYFGDIMWNVSQNNLVQNKPTQNKPTQKSPVVKSCKNWYIDQRQQFQMYIPGNRQKHRGFTEGGKRQEAECAN